jgi:hypothetical protein
MKTTDCVIRGLPNNTDTGRMVNRLKVDGVHIRKRGRGARNRSEHQELPMKKAGWFSAYFQSANNYGGFGDFEKRTYFDYIGISAGKPHLKLGAKTW